MQINNDIAIVDGEDVMLDAAPFLQEGITFVPLRFIAEAFGFEVEWCPKFKQIVIERSNVGGE